MDETKLKGETQSQWRQFCEEFNEVVADFNFGTILRIDAKGVYDDLNTVIVPKVINSLNLLINSLLSLLKKGYKLRFQLIRKCFR